MSTIARFAGALLVTSALVLPTLAAAQEDASAAPEAEEPLDEQVEISIPGGGTRSW